MTKQTPPHRIIASFREADPHDAAFVPNDAAAAERRVE
jgi:hypothetical protein